MVKYVTVKATFCKGEISMKTDRHLPETPRRAGFLYHLVKYRILLVMLLPAVIYFIIFSYIPMAGGVVAFKTFDYSKGIFGSPWAGFKNFKYLFASGKAWMLTKNTFVYNISFICSVSKTYESTC